MLNSGLGPNAAIWALISASVAGTIGEFMVIPPLSTFASAVAEIVFLMASLNSFGSLYLL